MANQDHLDILKQGVKVWNEWREQHPDVKPDLSSADLVGASLPRSNLRCAILSKTDLSNTNLIIADLSSADLSDADLTSAFLYNTNLSDANLLGAHLIGANLDGANLRGANLQRARLGATVFARTDLRQVKGLTEIELLGPSHVELHTVQLPLDGSARHFLRGCGVPDEWINFWQSPQMQPIQYYSVFISSSSKDEQLARRLHADLQNKGVRCWFASHDLPIGAKTRHEVDKAIYLQEKLLLILSAASVASDWVEHEVETALKKERKEKRTVLFPIRIDRAILDQPAYGWPELVRNERNIGDFSHWTDPQAYQQAFERLVRDLKKADE